MTQKLTARCPECGTKMVLPFNTVATEVYTRNCPNHGRPRARGMVRVCRRWRIIVVPRAIQVLGETAWVHTVTFCSVPAGVAAPNPQTVKP